MRFSVSGFEFVSFHPCTLLYINGKKKHRWYFTSLSRLSAKDDEASYTPSLRNGNKQKFIGLSFSPDYTPSIMCGPSLLTYLHPLCVAPSLLTHLPPIHYPLSIIHCCPTTAPSNAQCPICYNTIALCPVSELIVPDSSL